MAKRIQVLLEDDVDGSVAAETITFGLDGASYEIDLSEANAAKLREQLAAWVGHARKVGGRRGRRAASTGGGASTSEIREWAEQNGMKVAPRGRIPADVREAYEAAH